MQRQFRLGGGVARRAANLRGQGLIEYVLLIAVISLTVAFAGPPVAGAIGNQFTAIAGAVGGGITGGAAGGIGGIGGGTSGGTHTGGTAGGSHGTSGGTTVNPGTGSTGTGTGSTGSNTGSGSTGNTGTTGGGSSSGTVNPGSGSTGNMGSTGGNTGTTKPGSGSTGNTGTAGGNTGNTGSTGGNTGTAKPGSGSTGNTGSTGGNTGSTGGNTGSTGTGSSTGTTKPGSGSTGNTGSTGGNTSTKPSQPVPNPTDGLENKDPKDWTLIDQKVVAEDISKNGTGSKYYPAAKKAMDGGTKWKTALLDGKTLEYRIIGINHDNLANGSGKAGLTFMTTSTGIKSRMNSSNTNSTGWKNSELRAKMNGGEIWNLLPADLQNTIKPVTKLTVDEKIADSSNPVAVGTTDKLFLLSIAEIAPSIPENWFDKDPNKPSCLVQEGSQYEAFQGKVMNSHSGNPALAGDAYWWERTNRSYDDNSFLYVSNSGDPSDHTFAMSVCTVFPVFCF